MRHLSTWIYQHLGLSPVAQEKLLTSAILLVIMLLVRSLVLRLVFRRTGNSLHFQHWRRATNYFIGSGTIITLGCVWFTGFETVGVFLGFVFAGLILALKEPVLNFAGWVFIVSRKPFEVGHRIQISANSGDVVELGIFEFSILEISQNDQTTGRTLHIPNSRVFTNTVANFSKGLDYIWHEISLIVTFESNWEKAKEILKNIARERVEEFAHTAKTVVQSSHATASLSFHSLKSDVFTAIRPSGIELTLRFVCQPREKRDFENSISEKILAAFVHCDDIELAYPTQRFYNSVLESKAAIQLQRVQFTN